MASSLLSEASLFWLIKLPEMVLRFIFGLNTQNSILFVIFARNLEVVTFPLESNRPSFKVQIDDFIH